MTALLRKRGFTLLEVMIGLALLGFALVVLLRSAAGSIFASQESQMMGVVTDLGRGEMYEIEERLLKEGFMDTDQSEDGKNFADQGWPDITYDYKVQQVELPSFDTLQAMAKGEMQAKGSAYAAAAAYAAGSGSGSGSGALPPGVDPKLLGSAAAAANLGSDALNSFQNSALGGMLTMFGGFGGSASSGAAAAGASVISSQYQMFQQILKVSIRKVTLNMHWKVLGRPRDLAIVTYFTDQAAMDKVLNGLGATDQPDTSGSGSTGSGSSSRNTGSDHRTTTGSGK